ncbi:MAG: gluconokinase [Cyclobacteriaceae bacterium]|nr:gluconokinase [Cyclobacteriaceae bacterium]
MKHILAVDIGTTSAKALVVNQQGEVLTSARQGYPTLHSKQDYSEQNPDEVLEAVVNIVHQCIASSKEKIDGVSFSSAMHSLLLVDEKGVPLTPLVTWADLRSKHEANDIRSSSEGSLIYQETNTPVHPMSPLCKIAWFQKNEQALVKRAHKFIGIKEYLWHKFFGEYVVDHSIASATGLFSASTLSWSKVALQKVKIEDNQLSLPVSVYRPFTGLSDGWASKLGLSALTPWIIGASDGCLANLGSGAMHKNELSVTVGTSSAVRKAANKISPDRNGRTFSYLLDEQTVITGGASNNGAVLLQWYSENFLKEPLDVTFFVARAMTVAPGCDGLIFLPYVLGERAPVFDPDAAGTFIGVRQHHRQEHFMRAILEGIGFALLSIAEVVEQNSGAFESIVASGGFVKSAAWVQLVATIFGKPVKVRGTEDASALGAALLGFKALGEQVQFHFPSAHIFQPEKNFRKLYQDRFMIYKKLYPDLAGTFHALRQSSTM